MVLRILTTEDLKLSSLDWSEAKKNKAVLEDFYFNIDTQKFEVAVGYDVPKNEP